MNHRLAIAAALILVLNFGCATAEQRWFEKWHTVQPKASRGEVLAELGNPGSFKHKRDASGERELLTWQVNSYTACMIIIDPIGLVEEKGCNTDQVAYQAEMDRRAANWRVASQQMHEDQMQRERIQQEQSARHDQEYMESVRRRPTSTRCTSTRVYGALQTDCQSTH